MARKVDEWIADHDDQAIPRSVQLRIIRRSNGRCVQCQRAFDEKLKPQMDHRPSLISGEGSHRESMIFATCRECHTELSKQDLKERAEVNRRDRKKYGLKKKSRGGFTMWRGMDGSLRRKRDET